MKVVRAPSVDETQSLKKQVEAYQEPYQAAPVGLITLDKQGRICQLNHKAAALLGFHASWLMGRPFLVFVAKDDIRHFMDLLTRARQTSEQQTAEIDLLISNRPAPVQVLLKASLADEKLIYQVSLIDLTLTKSTEHQLSEVLNRWHSLVENAPDVIMTVDQFTRITYVNREAWGYSLETLLRTRLIDYVPEPHRTKVKACVSKAFEKRAASSCEVSEINGEEGRWYSLNFGTTYEEGIPNVRLKTVTVIIRDITELKRAEISLRGSSEQLREFAARIEMVREEERARIAREIHDELGQSLTILKLDLSWLQGRIGRYDGTRKKLKAMIADVDQTIDHVRRIVSELRPSILDDMGLPAAVEWQVSQFRQRTGIRATFDSNHDTLDLPPDTAAALFRVIQEALTNIVRHAGARQVHVSLKAAGGVLRIAVTDDGKGLSRQKIDDQKSFGLVGMRERLLRIGGEFNIFSGPGRGTRLEIAAPLQ